MKPEEGRRKVPRVFQLSKCFEPWLRRASGRLGGLLLVPLSHTKKAADTIDRPFQRTEQSVCLDLDQELPHGMQMCCRLHHSRFVTEDR